MVKREHPEIGLTVDQHDGEPAAQRARLEEPDHLPCPITREMLQAWLDENQGVTPDDWDAREMLPPSSPPSIDFYGPDLEVLREWRESCPELRDLWRGDDASHWEGVSWLRGRVTGLRITSKRLRSQLPLSGQLPRLDGLTWLQRIDLKGNRLSGPIPEKLFEGLTSLRGVRLSGNQLSGPIPEKLFDGLTSLQCIDFSGNQLSGPIPEKLFQGLTSLQQVLLSRNYLMGPIPEKLFEGVLSLQLVALHFNQLSGPIPEKLFEGVTSLNQVILMGNSLSGPIPERLRAVVKL